MPLTTEPLPSGAERVVDASVAELVGHGGIALPRTPAPSLSTPISLYHLGADALAEGRGLEAATHVGWMAALRSGSEVIGSLELAPVARPKKGMPGVRFAGFAQGPLHRGMAATMDAAAKQAGRRKVAARVLRAPAVYLLALWLNENGEDTLIPIAPAPAPLAPGQAVDASKALRSLAAAAKMAMSGEDTRN